MTPNNIINMAALCGLEIIALTDHNSSGNCRPLMELGRERGIIVVPGMELCTCEEIHVLCLFPEIDSAEAFSREVYDTLPPIKNRPEIFGRQLYLDEDDKITGEEERLLVIASQISVDDVPVLAAAHGGAAVLAHIDRQSNGALGVLGDIRPDMGYTLAELSYSATDPEGLKGRFPFLFFLKNSDSHGLESLAETEGRFFLEGEFSDAAGVVGALRKIRPSELGKFY